MVEAGQHVEDLDTPSLLVDLDRMERNIQQWQADISAQGVALRPHVKTHKVPDIARQQLHAGACGVTVAKVSEAEVFAESGVSDIFIAYPVIGQPKWKRIADLARTCTVTVGVDSEVGARGLSLAASRAQVKVRVRVEIDGGLNRCGVQPEQAESLCRLVMSLPALELDGIFGFRSIFYASSNGRSAQELGREEGELYVRIAEQLRHSGISIHSVSVGSTPTAKYAAAVLGVTEVRPGTYIFGDYMMAELGAVHYDDVALSILCTVVSRPAKDKATIDGGSKTFCGDSIPARMGLKGYARAVSTEAYVESMSEEHGVVRLGSGVDLKVGEKLAFFPIHVCTAVNLSDELVGIRNGRVEQVYPIAARGKRT